MNIEERLLRQEPEDIMEIGRLAHELLEGDRGALLYALTTGAIWEELKLKRENETTEEKIELIGKLRAHVGLVSSIERCIADRERLVGAIEEDERDETPIIDDMNPHRGGTI